MNRSRILSRRLARLQVRTVSPCVASTRLEDGQVLDVLTRVFPDGSRGRCFELPQESTSADAWLHDARDAIAMARTRADAIAAAHQARVEERKRELQHPRCTS